MVSQYHLIWFLVSSMFLYWTTIVSPKTQNICLRCLEIVTLRKACNNSTQACNSRRGYYACANFHKNVHVYGALPTLARLLHCVPPIIRHPQGHARLCQYGYVFKCEHACFQQYRIEFKVFSVLTAKHIDIPHSKTQLLKMTQKTQVSYNDKKINKWSPPTAG